jgi:hypothetical protein
MMTYYYIWNKMSILKGQIYVLKSKVRDGSISIEQINRLVELESDHEHLEMLEYILDQHGESGFNGYEPKSEFVDEWSKAKKTS